MNNAHEITASDFTSANEKFKILDIFGLRGRGLSRTQVKSHCSRILDSHLNV